MTSTVHIPASTPTSAGPHFLLVHGAWQGAWVWEAMHALLKVHGGSVHAFDLPGSGNDPTPAAQVTLQAYAQAIVAQARALAAGPLVLVGHSMGGAAITAAASLAPELFTRLIYVCAFVPRPGESVASLAKEGYALGGSGPQVALVADGHASALQPETIASTFFNDCPPEAVQPLLALFRPQPLAPVTAPATWSEGFQALPKTYVHCSLDRAIAPDLQTRMADRAGITDVRTLESGHEPFISQPAQLAHVLLQASAAD